MWAKSNIGVLGQKIWHYLANIWANNWSGKWEVRSLRRSALALVLSLSMLLVACGDRSTSNTSNNNKKLAGTNIAEVSPPPTIQKLNRLLDRYEPQLKIISPQPDRIIDDTKVAVQLEVRDLPIFKNADFGLGSHVQVLLDNQDYRSAYDLSQPLVFENLSAGTHTIRAFVLKPWQESFKNEGAYAQVTFHVYAKTGDNTPRTQVPLLSYSYPVDTVGTEPVLLDFYLRNAPLHLAAIEDENLTDWKIRASVNGQSFLIDQWHPIYLKGLKPGKNLMQLELLDRQGNPIINEFNSTARLIDYQPGGKDTLSRLNRSEVIAGIESIIDPNYQAIVKPPVKTLEKALEKPVELGSESAIASESIAPVEPVSASLPATAVSKSAEPVAPPKPLPLLSKSESTSPTAPPAPSFSTPAALPQSTNSPKSLPAPEINSVVEPVVEPIPATKPEQPRSLSWFEKITQKQSATNSAPIETVTKSVKPIKSAPTPTSTPEKKLEKPKTPRKISSKTSSKTPKPASKKVEIQPETKKPETQKPETQAKSKHYAFPGRESVASEAIAVPTSLTAE